MYHIPQDALDFVKNHKEEAKELVRQLCRIPSPSLHEDRRAAFIKQWLDEQGAKGAYIDSARNVILPINAEGSNDLTLFIAHTDTVFPDMDDLPMHEENGELHCPGAGDDTAGVAALMMVCKYFIMHNIQPKSGYLLVCNSGEEAQGNQYGVKQLMKDFAGRIRQVVVFDGLYNQVVNWPVAYQNYLVTIKAKGGHAYLNFGNPSAARCAGSIISDIYAMELPQGCKSSYNVGTIHGGTSANAIAQNIEMMVEMRSELQENLELIKSKFFAILENHKAEGIEITAEPHEYVPGKSGNPKPEIQEKLNKLAKETLNYWCGSDPLFRSGTGDLNIPMSMGIPGIAWAAYKCYNIHSRQEYLILDSMETSVGASLSAALFLADE